MIRWYNIWVHDGREWVLKSVQETAEKAVAARDYYLSQGVRPCNIKITQD